MFLNFVKFIVCGVSYTTPALIIVIAYTSALIRPVPNYSQAGTISCYVTADGDVLVVRLQLQTDHHTRLNSLCDNYD